MKQILQSVVVVLPWRLKRWCLVRWFGYDLHPHSHIGIAWVFPTRLSMAAGARIGHLTIVKGLALLVLGEQASIGRLNWITAYPLGLPPHFQHLPERRPELLLGDHAAITNRHLIDSTDRISLGRYATLAGFRSQILTHSIDLAECRQHARPVAIGDYCFVGTACTVLGGAVLPHHSVLGANSLLNKALDVPYQLYGGVPAQAIATLSSDLGYFHRQSGFVV